MDVKSINSIHSVNESRTSAVKISQNADSEISFHLFRCFFAGWCVKYVDKLDFFFIYLQNRFCGDFSYFL